MPTSIVVQQAQLANKQSERAIWDLLKFVCACSKWVAGLIGASSLVVILAMAAASWSLKATWPVHSYVFWAIAMGNGVAFWWLLGKFARHCERRAVEIQAECDRMELELKARVRQPPCLHKFDVRRERRD